MPRSQEPAASSSAPAQPAPALSTDTLSVLTNTSPIDRTRNQARLIFDKFDADADGGCEAALSSPLLPSADDDDILHYLRFLNPFT